MRTCPACGEETGAAMSEACTKCGFSPSGPEPEATFEVADAPGETEWSAAEPDPPAPEPVAPPTHQTHTEDKPPLINLPDEPEGGGEAPKPRKQSGLARGIGIVVAVAAIIGFRAIGNEDTPTGPEPSDVEQAITERAAGDGITMTVSCPDDTADTEVGGRFECDVTLPDGSTATARVLNQEDSYRWTFSRARQP
jgi:hypothetical protein